MGFGEANRRVPHSPVLFSTTTVHPHPLLDDRRTRHPYKELKFPLVQKLNQIGVAI
jgi:hypothetical protein